MYTADNFVRTYNKCADANNTKQQMISLIWVSCPLFSVSSCLLERWFLPGSRYCGWSLLHSWCYSLPLDGYMDRTPQVRRSSCVLILHCCMHCALIVPAYEKRRFYWDKTCNCASSADGIFLLAIKKMPFLMSSVSFFATLSTTLNCCNWIENKHLLWYLLKSIFSS